MSIENVGTPLDSTYLSITQSRLQVEMLIGQTSIDDEYSLGLLGPILSELRTAEATLKRLKPQQTNA